MRGFGSLRKMLLALVIIAVPASAFAGVFISVNFAPPPLPVYTQPICPAPGYLWTPGYWAYGPGGYYWVPGVWVRPPAIGMLWTPGYWSWGGGVYMWHAGYWGPHIGFYGGVNYGFGYTGVGFYGGYWRGGHYFYNTSVTRVNTTIIRNTYNKTVIVNNNNYNRVSYNGGAGGIRATASRQELAASREQRFSATQSQTAHMRNASMNRSQFYSQNRGRPQIAARDTVNGRAYNQQGRIAQGVRDGQIDRNQAYRDEQRQGRIDNSIRQGRRTNGGRLTQQERRNVNQRQNGASRQIYRQRHDGNGGGHPHR